MPKNDLTLFQTLRAKFPTQEMTVPAIDLSPRRKSFSADRANEYRCEPSPHKALNTRPGSSLNQPTTSAMPRFVRPTVLSQIVSQMDATSCLKAANDDASVRQNAWKLSTTACQNACAEWRRTFHRWPGDQSAPMTLAIAEKI